MGVPSFAFPRRLGLQLILFRFFDQRHFPRHFLQHLLGLRRDAHHLGAEKDQQFRAVDCFVVFAEDVIQKRDASQNRGFLSGIVELLLDDAAQHQGLASFGRQFGAELRGVNHHVRVDQGRFNGGETGKENPC